MEQKVQSAWDRINITNIPIVGVISQIGFTLFSRHKLSEIPDLLSIALVVAQWMLIGLILSGFMGLKIALIGF